MLILFAAVLIGFIAGGVTMAALLWYGSRPNEPPKCGCGHPVMLHGEFGCAGIEANGYNCRCLLTQEAAALAGRF